MNGEEFQKMIKVDKYQVFLFDCPANLPFSFARHTWFVINKYGELSRWEVLFRKHACETSWGYLHKNAFLPFQGIHIFPFSNAQKYLWKGRLLAIRESETARRIAEALENSPAAYSYCDKYSLTGPNSNTYVEWMLGKFPESNLKLPWNSFGKNYR